MWIRSQDRKNLVIPNEIWISVISNKQININANLDVLLGKYESEERAISVLNDIQNHIINITIIKYDGKNYTRSAFNDFIFEMPLE
jgi:hypothetical protein